MDLLAHWKIKPQCVAGHSSGEIAAAYCKGAITKESAWKLAYYRGRLSNGIKDLAPDVSGAMLAAGLGAEQIQDYLHDLSDDQVSIACINSPINVTLSGDSAAISQLKIKLEADGIFARQLKVETAYHSAHMRLISQAYWWAIRDVEVLEQSSDIKMFSSVTGELVEVKDLGPQY